MKTEPESTHVHPWRRLWHLAGGSVIPIAAFFLPETALLIFVGAVAGIFIALEIARFASLRLNHWLMAHLGFILKPQERYRPIGTTWLLVSTLAVFLLFEKYTAITALLFVSVGDFMAAVIGRRYGRHRIRGKSLEGSLACLAACVILAVAMAGLAHVPLPAALAGAVAATIVEFLSMRVDDNLTVPLASAAVMWFLGA